MIVTEKDWRCRMIRLIFSFFWLTFLQDSYVETKSYEGYRVYEAVEKEKYSYLQEKIRNVDVLNERRIYTTNNVFSVRSYLVHYSQEKNFLEVLEKLDASSRLTVENLQELIEEESRTVRKMWFPGDDFFSKIHLSFDEMKEYLKYISQIRNSENGEFLAKVEVIGKSYEGRIMHGVKISSDHSGNKPILFVEAGIHAREWVTMAAARYMINQLVLNYTQNADVLRGVDFYIIPMSNPDGYEYSRTEDRLWLKNRSYRESNDDLGVDLNRNFDFPKWKEALSSDPSSDQYKGPNALSESEVRHIEFIGRKYKSRIKTFVSIQAFGSLVLYPWGYKYEEPPKLIALEFIGEETAKVLNRSGSSDYKVGQNYKYLYNSEGNIADYFMQNLSVPFVFTLKLSAIGRSSFVLPPPAVSVIVKDTYEGFKVIAKYTSNIIIDETPKKGKRASTRNK